MSLTKFQMAVVERYAKLVLRESLKAGNKPVEAVTDAAMAAEKAEKRFQDRNWRNLQAAMNDSMLGAVRWS